jgi:hypothetical protein
MPRFTQDDAECRVFTFKEGLLSPIAHDLEIAVERFSIEWDESKLEARFDPSSLRVLHARKEGRADSSALSDKDKRKIEANIQGDVLEVKRHPAEIVFAAAPVPLAGGAGGEGAVRGELQLHGRARTIEARVRRDGERWIGEATLHQPDFGITPYSAMMGALRVKADVEIRVRAPK